MSDIKNNPIKVDKNGKIKSVRISARIAPNYKNGLDLIVRDRQSNLSEVLELAIIRLLNNYEIDNKKAMDYVGDSNLLATNLFFDIRMKTPTKETISSALDKLYENLPPSDVPLSLVSPKERYKTSIITSLISKDAYISFYPISIILAIETAWNEALPENLVIDTIEMVDLYAKEIMTPSLQDKEIQDSHKTLLCFLADNEEVSINQYYADVIDRYKKLKAKYRYN